jgi:hypothetical protein
VTVGLVWARGRAALPLLAAAGLTLLLASTSVCLAVLYAQSVTQAGLSQLLTSSPEDRRTVLVSADLDQETDDGAVRESLADAFAPTPVDVSSSVLSDDVLVRAAGSRGAQVQVLAGPDLPGRVEVVEGVWPAPPAQPGELPVAVSPTTAAELDVAVGSLLRLDAGRAGAVTARVTAVVLPLDAGSAFWAGQGAQLADGVDDAGEAAAGPLLTSPALPAALARDAVVRWLAEPDLAGLTVHRVPVLRSTVATL